MLLSFKLISKYLLINFLTFQYVTLNLFQGLLD
jgi:hypothetical protein